MIGEAHGWGTFPKMRGWTQPLPCHRSLILRKPPPQVFTLHITYSLHMHLNPICTKPQYINASKGPLLSPKQYVCTILKPCPKKKSCREKEGGETFTYKCWGAFFHVKAKHHRYQPLFCWPYIAKKLCYKLKMLKSSFLGDFQQPEFEKKNLRKITRFLQVVQVGSTKNYIEGCFLKILMGTNFLHSQTKQAFSHSQSENQSPMTAPVGRSVLSRYFPQSPPCPPTQLPTCLSTNLPSLLLAYLCTYIPAYLPIYLHAYLPTYLHACLPTYPPTFLLTTYTMPTSVDGYNNMKVLHRTL